MQGYESEGVKVPWATQLGDLYRKNKRAQNKDPYQLPQRFFDRVGDVDFTVPYNFISTNDIIGGNSGSPVVDKELQVVGLIFDGNIEQLPNRFLFRDRSERSVSVHVDAIIEAMAVIYGADRVVKELTGSTGN